MFKTLAAVSAACLLLLGVFAFAQVDWNASNKQKDTPVLDSVPDNFSLVETGRTRWQYRDDGTPPPPDANGLTWILPNYGGTADWQSAAGSFGSENGQRTDRVNDRYPTNLPAHYTAEGASVPVYYFRTEFDLNQLFSGWTLRGKIQYDDTVVVTLNGTVIYEGNVPEQGFDAAGYGAQTRLDTAVTQSFTLANASALRRGKNVLAVELHQAGSTSTDMYFDFLSLEYTDSAYVGGDRAEGSMILEPSENAASVRVNWLTEERGAYTLLYTTAKGQLSQNASQMLTMEQHSDTKNAVYCYTAVMYDLPPGIPVQYRVMTSDGARMSPSYIYTTRDPLQPVSFLLAGDPQIGADAPEPDLASWSTTLEIANAIQPNADFLVCAGDMIDSSNAQDALEETFLFRSPPLLTQLPLLAVKGNHDGSLYDLQYQRSTTKQEADHFLYENVLFVRLNTNNKNYEAQRQYLEKAVTTYPARWVVVLMHYSMFSTGPHAQDDSIAALREEYADTFSRLNVDLVLSGHDHLYSRSYLMQGQIPTGRESGEKLPGETLYLTANSSTGSKYYDSDLVQYDYLAKILQEKSPYLTTVQATDTELRVQTYRISDRAQMDAFLLTKDPTVHIPGAVVRDGAMAAAGADAAAEGAASDDTQNAA